MKKKPFHMLAVSWVLIVFLIPFSANAADAKQLDIQAISDAAGTKASMTADGVARIGWSRDKVPVEVDGLDFPSAAGLGSWAAFKPVPAGGVMVMGDTVVFEDEITPAMDAAFAHGLEITALHNHFVFDRPPAYFMHIGGHAQNAAELARGVKAIWDAIKGVREARPVPADRFAGTVPNITGEYDTAALEKILKAEGKRNGKVVKFTFERTASMHGAKLGESLGLATWAAFSGNQGHAVVDGDFAMTAAEVQPVMHALRKAGLHIVALHNHMIGETPAYYFLHYWGKGEPQQLAQGVRAALDTQQR